MSPVAFHNFRSTQTRLDLNGPTIAISENPTDVTTQAVGVTRFVGVAGTVGVATFIGVSTATLGTPNAPGVYFSGIFYISVAFRRWYKINRWCQYIWIRYNNINSIKYYKS